uniref:Mitogen-activated protein kinase binding protein 1 n=1 Tax=Gasterosteus aculeatus TaxID=69293 RepID=G3NIK6_GASAC
AMAAEGSGTIRSRIKNLLRSPSIKLRRFTTEEERLDLSLVTVTLEKVLGITAPGNRALACDPRTGLLAYPAGSPALLSSTRLQKPFNTESTLRETDWSTLRAVYGGSVLQDNDPFPTPSYLLRVELYVLRIEVGQFNDAMHAAGFHCIEYTKTYCTIISCLRGVSVVHSVLIKRWSYQKNVVVSANKVSSKVTAVSFSDDSSYFVTAGNRHVKFWYLDHGKTSKANATVPLLGRSGLLGELRNNFFSDVACGRGRQASSTFCITSSGLLCEFNDRRLLDKWVELRASQATCLSVTDELIFCGCSDGTVRAFSPVNLHFLCSLPRPHCLGADVASMVDASQLFSGRPEARYPDTVAVTYDPASCWLSCVYNDHSVYVWDVRDIRDPRRAGKLYSALYHSSCVWSLEVYPEEGGGEARLPPGSYLSCSSDNTIRLWNTEGHKLVTRNILSPDLQKVIYMDDNVSTLLDPDSTSVTGGNLEKGGSSGSDGLQTDQSRAGIRTLRVSPDGQHLASGDRMGVLRIHDLDGMVEILNVQAHDSEILCLEFSKPDTGLQLLATASRDRLIHVLDAGRDYSLLQTLDEHSSSITAVRFAANEGKVRMISCGADKSVYFRTAQQVEEGLEFTRTHHVVRKTTLYDMDVEPTRKYAAVGCQDRRIRIFNISNGKQKKMYKGSQGEDGTLIKVQIDPSGLYIATSCSDKNISIFDFYSGECVATMFGHSEIVTGLRFSSDCRHLITVSGDSCIFVWRLSPELTIRMRQRLADLRPSSITQTSQNAPQQKVPEASSPRVVIMSSDSDRKVRTEGEKTFSLQSLMSSQDQKTKVSLVPGTISPKVIRFLFETLLSIINSINNNLPGTPQGAAGKRLPRRRWSRRTCNGTPMVKSMLDLRLLDSVSPHPRRPSGMGQCVGEGLHRTNQELGSTVSLQAEDGETWTNQRPDFIPLSNQSPDGEAVVLYPDQWEDRVSLAGRSVDCTLTHNQISFLMQSGECGSGCRVGPGPGYKHQDKPSPDSGCSLGFSSRLSSPVRPAGDGETDTGRQTDKERHSYSEPLSVDGNSSEDVMTSQLVPQTPDQEAFLKEHFVTLANLSKPGSPSKASHSSSESISISSRFLSQNPAGKVRPLMDENQDRRVSWNQDQTSSAYDQAQNQQGAGHLQVAAQPTHRPNPLKKKVQTAVESKRNLGPTARAAASHLSSSSGLRKAQSVQNLLTDTDTPSSPLQEAAILPTTLSASGILRKSSSSTLAPLRSYMSPTASSMAKMSRSVSVGDEINMATPPQAAIVPVVVAASSSLSNHGNQAGPFPRGLQARIPGNSRPLPDKPSLTSFSSVWLPPGSASPLTPPRQGEEPQTLAGGGRHQRATRLRRFGLPSSCHLLAPPPPLPPDIKALETGFDVSLISDQPISVETCRALTNELQSCFKRATHLYRKVSGSSPDQRQMAGILSEAFQAMRAELNCLPVGASAVLGAGGGLGEVGEGKTAALLEEYSLLLLQAVHRRMDNME